MSLQIDNITVEWRGHATVSAIDNGFTIVVDPYQMEDLKADIVMITHSDAGHLDIESLEKCCGAKSCVVIPESIDEKIIPCDDVESICEGTEIDIYGVKIESIPMYNENHDRGSGIGYLFEMAGTSIYVAGDTGDIEEARNLEGRVDLAFLPVEGVYTMGVNEAINMSVKIKPSIVVPYHYGPPNFTAENPDLRFLKAELEDRNINCEIIDQN